MLDRHCAEWRVCSLTLGGYFHIHLLKFLLKSFHWCWRHLLSSCSTFEEKHLLIYWLCSLHWEGSIQGFTQRLFYQIFSFLIGCRLNQTKPHPTSPQFSREIYSNILTWIMFILHDIMHCFNMFSGSKMKFLHKKSWGKTDDQMCPVSASRWFSPWCLLPTFSL